MSSWKEIKSRLDPLNLKKGHYEPENDYGFPTIYKQDFDIKQLVPFGNKNFKGTAHFFLYDFIFERVWNKPKKYIDILKRYQTGVLSPDFSLYTDYPIAVQIWNTYRNRWCGRYWQDQGIKVIPTIGWSTPESYKFCFQGIERGSTVAISTLGVLQNKEATKLFQQGYNEMTQQIHPEKIIIYGRLPEQFKKQGQNIEIFTDFMTQRRQTWEEEAAAPATDSQVVPQHTTQPKPYQSTRKTKGIRVNTKT